MTRRRSPRRRHHNRDALHSSPQSAFCFPRSCKIPRVPLLTPSPSPTSAIFNRRWLRHSRGRCLRHTSARGWRPFRRRCISRTRVGRIWVWRCIIPGSRPRGRRFVRRFVTRPGGRRVVRCTSGVDARVRRAYCARRGGAVRRVSTSGGGRWAVWRSAGSHAGVRSAGVYAWVRRSGGGRGVIRSIRSCSRRGTVWCTRRACSRRTVRRIPTRPWRRSVRRIPTRGRRRYVRRLHPRRWRYVRPGSAEPARRRAAAARRTCDRGRAAREALHAVGRACTTLAAAAAVD